VILTFSITTGAEPWLRRTNSCSTIAPERTWPKSKRASENAALGAPEVTPGDRKASLAVFESRAAEGDMAGSEPQEKKRGEKARNTILFAAREITNALLTGFRQSRVWSRPWRDLQYADTERYSFR